MLPYDPHRPAAVICLSLSSPCHGHCSTWLRHHQTTSNNQGPQPEQSRTSQSAFGAPCRRPSSDPRISGNLWTSDIFRHQVCSTLDHYQFCWHRNSTANPKAKILQKQYFPLNGETWRNYIRSIKELVLHHKDRFTSWVCNDEGRPPTKIPRPSSCETSRDCLDKEPTRAMSTVHILYRSISCYTVRWLHPLAAGGKKVTAYLPIQPWRQEYLVKWCKTNQNIAQIRPSWHWMIRMRTHGRTLTSGQGQRLRLGHRLQQKAAWSLRMTLKHLLVKCLLYKRGTSHIHMLPAPVRLKTSLWLKPNSNRWVERESNHV